MSALFHIIVVAAFSAATAAIVTNVMVDIRDNGGFRAALMGRHGK